MDYLTVQKLAELKNCSISYISRLIKTNKIPAKSTLNPVTNKIHSLIPVSSLSEDLQAKYYAKLKADTGLAPELKDDKTALKQRSKRVQRSFEEYSEEERERIAFWSRLVREWHENRDSYKSKTKYDTDFCANCRLQYGEDFIISPDILYRKYEAYLAHDYDTLISKRGGWNRGTSSIRTEVWHIYASLYLSYQNPKISKCYRDTVAWCVTNYPEFVDGIPEERTFRRRTEKELKGAVASWVRDGEQRCLAKFGIFAERDYSDLEANDVWIFDNHTLDIRSIAPDGRIHRMSLTAIQDAKSGVIVGYNPCDDPCSQSTLFAIHRAVSNGYGLCRYAYLDNGSEFSAADITGQKSHRSRKHWNKDEAPPPIFELLGIEAQFALPANPDAKNIERFFFTFKEQFSKSTGGFCGGTVVERHKCMNEKEKNLDLPTDEEVIKLLDLYIKSYNADMYGGKEAKYREKRRIDVWNESVNSDRVKFRDVASEKDLALLLARSTRYQKIKRDGVFVNMYGKKIWFRDSETPFNIDKEVYVRFDPYNLDSVRVYERETGKYLWTYPRADYLDVPFLAAESEDGKDRIAEFQKKFAETRKAIKSKAESYTNSPYAADSLAAAINEMKLTAADYEVKKPAKFEPVTAQEIDIEYPEREEITDVDYSELEELRAMNNRLEMAKKGA